MAFKAYKDSTFETRVDAFGEQGYQVMINPETFDRTLNVNSSQDNTARPGNSSGHDAGLGPESYSFDLMFDGTGVVGAVMKGASLKEEFQSFMEVVYAKREDLEEKKQANCVTIKYCGETFYAKLTSMTIKYLLFQRDGNPLRIKATCNFSSVEAPKKDPKTDEKPKKPKPKDKPKVKQDSQNKECCCPCPNYYDTVSSAKENDSVSLMSCNYTRAEMTPAEDLSSHQNHQSLNYTPAYGMSY